MSHDILFKFISVGDSGVGKSCLLLRLTQNDYVQTETTIGIEFGSTLINIDGKKVKLQIWDTAGQESFRSISRAYYRNAIGALLVYDITRRETFSHLLNWLQDVSNHGNESIRIILVANKSDQDFKRVVTREEGLKFARDNNMSYIETSAKSGLNVQECFQILAKTVFEDLKLDRNPTDLSSEEVKKLEAIGVKIGPKTPIILIDPSKNENTTNCCF